MTILNYAVIVLGHGPLLLVLAWGAVATIKETLGH